MTFKTKLAALAVSGLALSALYAPAAMAQSTSCADVIAADPQLSRSASALERTGILEGLRASSPVTIFVPTNEAIARHPSDLAERLFPQGGSNQGGQMMDPVAAPAAVNAHILDGRHPASEFTAGQTLRTRNGTTIDVAAAQDGLVTLSPTAGRFTFGLKSEQARIVQADVPCSNGLIHKVNDVLVR